MEVIKHIDDDDGDDDDDDDDDDAYHFISLRFAYILTGI